MTARHYIAQAHRQQRTEIEGEEVAPPPAVCHTADQRDVGSTGHRLPHLCVHVDSALQKTNEFTKKNKIKQLID